MSKVYNREKPIVHNTYQMYLKRSAEKLENHMEVKKKMK